MSVFCVAQRTVLLSNHFRASSNLSSSATSLSQQAGKMSYSLYQSDTPDEVKNAKGLHLITMSTPNGQKTQIMLEELVDLYPGTSWTTTKISIMTNEQKKVCLLAI